MPELTDHEAAEAMRDGAPSPLKYGDFWLFDLRITGTGAAYRPSRAEWALRDDEEWTSPAFLKRCNGLTVIQDHPEGLALNSEEFRERAIGTIVLPYVKGDEVWGIAKIFDADAAVMMQTTHTSTSPGVISPKGAKPATLESGTQVLDEPLPRVLDHLAICSLGVWDKGDRPEGVRLDALDRKDATVTEAEEKAKLEKERDDAIARADAADKARADAMKRVDDFEMADKARKDADETKAAEEKAEREKADKAKKDSRKDRHSKHDGEIMDCSRCDSEESEEKEREEKAKADKAKKDAVETVDPNSAETIKDSKAFDALKADFDSFKREMAAQNAPLSHEDANAISKAFHRADRVLRMHGEAAHQQYPGEKPQAYRRRLADQVRKHAPLYASDTIHDSAQGRAFDLIEDEIYAQAEAAAKNPVINDSNAFRLVEEVDTTTMHGKRINRFHGDPRAAYAPFRQQRGYRLTRINRPQGVQS